MLSRFLLFFFFGDWPCGLDWMLLRRVVSCRGSSSSGWLGLRGFLFFVFVFVWVLLLLVLVLLLLRVYMHSLVKGYLASTPSLSPSLSPSSSSPLPCHSLSPLPPTLAYSHAALHHINTINQLSS
jgi:hypothetical protein